jgi:hypothetical protein
VNKRFRQFVAGLEPAFRQLVEAEPVRIQDLPALMPARGIYLFSEKGRHLYVGRSNNLRRRLQEHFRPSSTHNSAPFAFRLTRGTTGHVHASYTTKGSRETLAKSRKFKEAFTRAKERVRRMQVRFVEENDPLKQALLEMYTAVALHTPYNDFDTH